MASYVQTFTRDGMADAAEKVWVSAFAMARSGHPRAVANLLAEWVDHAKTPPDLRCDLLCLRAWVEISEVGAEILPALQHALRRVGQGEVPRRLGTAAPDMLAELCAEALARDVASEQAHRLIRLFTLRPPSPALERWPYPLRVHTLGRPAIVVDAHPLRFSGKAQRRPLELLHCLIAHGGRDVAVSRLAAELWPREEDAVSRGAFDMALKRLRQLLREPAALRLECSRLSLSDEACWIDIRVLERLLGDVDRASDLDRGLDLMQRALCLYQGDFLEGEDAPWALLARERLRARLLRGVRRLGQSMESAGRWPDATRLYERVREIFPLEEDLCQRLLRGHMQQGEFTQATHLYGRCRALFAKVLGVMPSGDTTALVFGSRTTSDNR